MRAGSGAVLLVGFALVVMLLSTAEALAPHSIGIKQDPSQDFIDIVGAINEIANTCSSFKGEDSAKYTYMVYMLKMLKNETKVKGMSIDDDTPSAAAGSCSIVYKLRSWDNSSYFMGLACGGDPELCRVLRDYLEGKVPERISSIVIIPPALCFRDEGKGQKESSTHFLIGNPNPIRVHVVLKYVGDDEVKNLGVSFPGQGIGTVKDDDHDGVLEFYLDPMTEPKGKGVALGQRTMGDAFINIKHNGTGRSSKLVIIVPEYNFEQDIPIYWNECPVISWGQVLKSLRG